MSGDRKFETLSIGSVFSHKTDKFRKIKSANVVKKVELTIKFFFQYLFTSQSIYALVNAINLRTMSYVFLIRMMK